MTQTPTLGPANHTHTFRVRCPDCLDRGYLLTVNPAYIHTFRHTFEGFDPIGPHETERMTHAREWYRRAAAWCRRNGTGPLVAAVTCECDSAVARARRDRLSETRDGCVHRPAMMPVVHHSAPYMIANAIAAYVAETDPVQAMTDAHEWQP